MRRLFCNRALLGTNFMQNRGLWPMWPFRRRERELIRKDADALMRAYGEAAYDHARTTAREIRLGQVKDEPRPAGHWDKVRPEIGRRAGRDKRVDTATRYLES